MAKPATAAVARDRAVGAPTAERLARLLRPQLPTPLYYQIFCILRDRILAGELVQGSRIPTEFELADAFDVSRITAKRALDELAAEGLVERRRGRGTHVTHRSRREPVQAPLVGLLESLEILAENTDVQLIHFRRAVPPQATRTLFASADDEELANAIRVRLRDGVPFGHYVSWTRTGHKAFNAENLARTSRIRLFKRCGVRIAKVEQTLSAVVADTTLASRLKVEPGTALLTLERRSFDPDGRLVDLLQIHYRPDQFCYQMTLTTDGRDRQ